MKRLKKIGLYISILFVFFHIFTFSASASDTAEELYKRQYEASGANRLESMVPEDTNDILNDMGINPEDPNNILSLKKENIFELASGFLADGIKLPLKTALSVIGILLMFASFDGVAVSGANGNMSIFVCFIASLVATAPVFSLMEGVKTAVQDVSTFMLGFVPVYTGILLSSSNTITASGFSTLLLGASEVISYLMSYFFVPISGAVLCLGMSGGISPIPIASRLSAWIKKTSIWAMGIATTIFLSILSLQSSFATVAEGVTMRASKAVLSTTIPIMGPAIAETINTARGCLSLLKSGIGIYAIIVIVVLALPIVIQLILWRVSMWITAGVAEVFGMNQVENVLRAVDYCLSVLFSATCFITLLFIISLAIGTGAG